MRVKSNIYVKLDNKLKYSVCMNNTIPNVYSNISWPMEQSLWPIMRAVDRSIVMPLDLLNLMWKCLIVVGVCWIVWVVFAI